ncbi:MAG: hypothetical protein IJ111_13275 [Eggerthellaceae bacterium]|nr:hypothetical protein [Eggerthellaceae bacterium]
MPLKKKLVALFACVALCASFVPVLAIADPADDEAIEAENDVAMTAQAEGEDAEMAAQANNESVTVIATATGGNIDIAVNDRNLTGGEVASVNKTDTVGNTSGTNKVVITPEFTLSIESIAVKVNDVVVEDVDWVVDATEAWTANLPASPDVTYTFDVKVKSETDTFTVVWDYSGDFPPDALLLHGKASIDEGNGIEKIPHEGEGLGELYAIQAGTLVTIHITPDYGYQLESASLNGVQVTAGSEVSSFTFTMPRNQLHFSSLFTPVEDNVQSGTDQVISGTIENADGIIDSGNLQLTVNEMDDAETQAAMDAQKTNTADAAVMYLDLDLNQVVNKGTTVDGVATDENSWTISQTDLDHAITVTLRISDAAAATGGPFYIIREHDGAYERIECTYDAATQTISFQTDKFSEYALMTDSAAATKASKSTLAKTGDPLTAGGMVVMGVVALGAVVFATRKLREQR